MKRIYSIFLVAGFLALLYTGHLVLPAILSVSFFLFSLFKCYRDHKELKTAHYYARTAKRESPSTKGWLGIFALTAVIIGVTILLNHLTDNSLNQVEGSPLFIFIGIGIIAFDWYQYFNGSMRAFEGGIKLPTHNQLIPWTTISAVKTDSGIISLQTNDFVHKITIIREDWDDLNNIKALWRNRASSNSIDKV